MPNNYYGVVSSYLDDTAHLQHWGIKKGEQKSDHKYVLRVGSSGHYKYYYPGDTLPGDVEKKNMTVYDVEVDKDGNVKNVKASENKYERNTAQLLLNGSNKQNGLLSRFNKRNDERLKRNMQGAILRREAQLEKGKQERAAHKQEYDARIESNRRNRLRREEIQKATEESKKQRELAKQRAENKEKHEAERKAKEWQIEEGKKRNEKNKEKEDVKNKMRNDEYGTKYDREQRQEKYRQQREKNKEHQEQNKKEKQEQKLQEKRDKQKQRNEYERQRQKEREYMPAIRERNRQDAERKRDRAIEDAKSRVTNTIDSAKEKQRQNRINAQATEYARSYLNEHQNSKLTQSELEEMYKEERAKRDNG